MSNLRKLDSFGDIAAEDDSVLDYFLTTDAVSHIESGDCLLVLGRKGSGKTALVRHFTEAGAVEHGKPLSLRNYPWGSHQLLVDKGASGTEVYVASWKLLIAIRLASMVCKIGDSVHLDALASLRKFLQKNFGHIDPDTRDILTQGRLSVTGLSIEPKVAGISIASITFGDPSRDSVLGLELHSLTNSILKDVGRAISQLNIERLFLHFDELDQGLDKVDDTRAKMLTGLILAAREMRLDNGISANISPVVYLRTDIWEQLDFSDKNKVTRTAAIQLYWDSESLLELVNVRLAARLGEGTDWEDVDDGSKMRGSQSKWNHILGRTLLRPRDVIQFLNEALSVAKSRPEEPVIFQNADINDSRENYSEYLKEELDDEIKPHWRNWIDGLHACSKTQTITFKKADFERNYRKVKTSDNKLQAQEALEMLYRFSIIGYESRPGSGGSTWSFRYSDPTAGWDLSAPRFKVHPGLKEYAKLKEERA